MAIFFDYIDNFMEVFMGDISIFGSFDVCLANLSTVLKRCQEVNLVLSWEKSHFIVQEGIGLGHKVSKKGIEADKAKLDLISNMPGKHVRSFLIHADFYRRFIKDFSEVACPLTNLLIKYAPFVIDELCVKTFEKLRSLLVPTPIVQPSDFCHLRLCLMHLIFLLGLFWVNGE